MTKCFNPKCNKDVPISKLTKGGKACSKICAKIMKKKYDKQYAASKRKKERLLKKVSEKLNNVDFEELDDLDKNINSLWSYSHGSHLGIYSSISKPSSLRNEKRTFSESEIKEIIREELKRLLNVK